MTLFTCAAVKRRLHAFYDGELPVPEMIEIQAHAGGCALCASELHQVRALGEALRGAAVPGPADDWTGVEAGVIGRMRAEAHESLSARTRRMFDDLHLVWIGLAATTAALICGTIALASLHFSSSDRQDSLAAMIAVISAPSGSDVNPVRADGYSLQAPSVPREGPIKVMLAETATEEELVLALSAVVTREGRFAEVSILNDLDEVGRDAGIGQIMDVLEHARLEPGRRGASPVAVNLVWLLAHTTVRPEPSQRRS